MKPTDVSRELGRRWRLLSSADKVKYTTKYGERRKVYDVELAAYSKAVAVWEAKYGLSACSHSIHPPPSVRPSIDRSIGSLTPSVS